MITCTPARSPKSSTTTPVLGGESVVWTREPTAIVLDWSPGLRSPLIPAVGPRQAGAGSVWYLGCCPRSPSAPLSVYRRIDAAGAAKTLPTATRAARLVPDEHGAR